MGTTRYYEYRCPCGNKGSYSTHSVDWLLKILFGMGYGSQPKCLRCQKVVCDHCKVGKYCESCAKEAPSMLTFLHSTLSILMIILVVPFALIILMLTQGVDLSFWGPLGMIIPIVFILLRISKHFIAKLIQSSKPSSTTLSL